MIEIEGKGLDYERFAMNKLFKRFVRDYGIRTVLEIPAKGEKAIFRHRFLIYTGKTDSARVEASWKEFAE